MNEETIIKRINNISKQFLCTFPLLKFNWQNLFDAFITEQQQEYLLSKTVNSKLVFEYPISINYQKLFLKQIIIKLESLQSQSVRDETVIHDNVYSAYARLVAAGDGSVENYKHYSVDNENKVITLKESNSLISDGTTGLRTWQASLALSEWIIQNKNRINDRTVLELGSGVGLIGCVLKMICSPKSIFLTDCHEAVLKTLCRNVEINLSNPTEDVQNSVNFNNCFSFEERCWFSDDNPPKIAVLNLPWEKFDSNICNDLGRIEMVIAADIVYDTDLFEPLLCAIKSLKRFCGVNEFIFACTERNADTLGEFLGLISGLFLHIDQLVTPEQSTFLWPDETPVKIYRFKD